MRVAIVQAQGDMGASGEEINIGGDLRLDVLELIEEARVDLSHQHGLNEGGTLRILT